MVLESQRSVFKSQLNHSLLCDIRLISHLSSSPLVMLGFSFYSSFKMRKAKDRKLWFTHLAAFLVQGIYYGTRTSVTRTFNEGRGNTHMRHPGRDQQSHPLWRLMDPYLCSSFSKGNLLSEDLQSTIFHYYISFLTVISAPLYNR